jgi:diaminopimelate decarboxylase
MIAATLDRLLPDTAEIGESGHLIVGGCDLLDLAARFGTPLIVYDEEHLRSRCRAAAAAFPGGVSYASKAFTCRAMAALAHEEGLRLDVASAGEFLAASLAGVSADRIVVHGNNKSVTELELALRRGVHRIVIDSAVPYTAGEPAPDVTDLAEVVHSAAKGVQPAPTVSCELGRWIVATAGITLYTGRQAL